MGGARSSGSAREADVAGWWARRTYTASAFARTELEARKRASGARVSVVVPTLDEGATVGAVVGAAASLVGTLVDEVVVVDGGSSDGTPDAAAAAGARVLQDAALLPEEGPVLGKGDALWRSLAATTGDLVVFVDADVRNPSPAAVAGLLGPLLIEESVQLVKACYDRPLDIGGHRLPSGGGRVTELCARPLLNLHWPALAGLAQPLAGEYAGRRELLESVPFSTGYGVELGLLVDVLELMGADAIAQVDIGVRQHRNRDLRELSRMAFGILGAAERRLARGPAPTSGTAFHQPGRDASGALVLPPPWRSGDLERPPLQERRRHA